MKYKLNLKLRKMNNTATQNQIRWDRHDASGEED